MQAYAECHYWIILEKGTTKCDGVILPLKTEFIFLIIFDILCPFASSTEWTATTHGFFCIRGDRWVRKLISFKASCGKLQRKISPSEDYSAGYRAQVWSVHSSILFIQPSFLNRKFKGRNTTSWLLAKTNKPVCSVTSAGAFSPALLRDDGLNTSTCPTCFISLHLSGDCSGEWHIWVHQAWENHSTLWTETPWNSQRPQDVINLIFQEIKRNITFYVALMKLASRSSATSQILKELATQFKGTQSLQNLSGVTLMCPLVTDGTMQLASKGESSWILCQISQFEWTGNRRNTRWGER